jgi:ribosomal protein L11 methylase PrmA
MKEKITPTCCVMNIVEGKLSKLLAAGVSSLLPAGKKYIFSGLLEEQLPAFSERAKSHGLSLLEVLDESEWRAMVFMNTALPPASG